LLNSSLYDNYYRILNGSTQVNSTEINQMPIPQRSVIEKMGQELMYKELSVENCNEILQKWII
jgi:adenine-specific DNA-methyltransferase